MKIKKVTIIMTFKFCMELKSKDLIKNKNQKQNIVQMYNRE